MTSPLGERLIQDFSLTLSLRKRKKTFGVKALTGNEGKRKKKEALVLFFSVKHQRRFCWSIDAVAFAIGIDVYKGLERERDKYTREGHQSLRHEHRLRGKNKRVGLSEGILCVHTSWLLQQNIMRFSILAHN